MRVSGKRTFSRGSPLDIVVTIVIGSNLSRALTGNAPFFGTLVASAAFVGLYRLLAQVCHRWPSLDRVFKGKPVHLIDGGVVDTAALGREAMTRGDLDEAMRAKGVEEAAQVRLAVLENSGQISVIKAP